MSADLSMGFGITGADEVARHLASVAGQLGRLTQRQQQNATAGREMAQSGAQASQSFQSLVGQGQQLTTRIQGAASAVQTLASAFGSRNHTAGLLASMAGSTAQFAAMGSMLGPAGTVVGGILGFAAGIVGLASAHREVRPEIEETTRTIEHEGEIAQTAASRMRDFLDSISTASRSAAVGDLGATITELTDEMYALRDAGDGLGAEVMAERIRTLQRFAESERQNIEGEVGETDAPTRGGGGRDASHGPQYGGLATSAEDTSLTDLIGNAGQQTDAAAADAERTADRLAGIMEGLEASYASTNVALHEASEEFGAMADKQREVAELNEEIRHTADNLANAFGNVTGSLEEVARAWTEARRAQAAAGQSMMTEGALLERSLVSVGNSIADTVGGTMLGAFEKAMGAWLDGTKTFVEAAEEMVKGVLKALVIESVVQAVAETARGIAGVASSYGTDPTAYQHFAAAAAWAAVGVAAGAVGAGIGAFGGGGGGAQQAPTSRELAGSQQSERGGDTYEINVFPGGFITQDQVSGGIVDGLNRAARNGRRVDSRLLGR